MDDSELAAWLALYHLPDLPASRLHNLVGHFSSATAMLGADPAQLRSLGLGGDALSHVRLYQQHGRFADRIEDCIRRDLDWRDAADSRRILPLEADGYPPLLRTIPDPPPILYLEGCPEVFEAPLLAMVGSRRPTPAGRRLARRFAAGLAGQGFAICSGLAYGIDRESHSGALQGGGRTLAVLGSGLERVYPGRHRGLLAEMIAGGGAALSEFPLDAEPLGWRFPRRNRVVTGLSLGVLVVEATLNSGSLVSARCAVEQGREVFAVPGNIDNPAVRGCHALLRQGAVLTETVGDILQELGHFAGRYRSAAHPEPEAALGLTPPERAVMAAVGQDPASIARLQGDTGLDIGTLSAVLGALELKGCIVRDSLGYVAAERDARPALS